MILYFDCFSGISGDMTLGALLDLGADLEALRRELGKLHLHDEFTLELSRKRVGAIDAAKADVHLHKARGEPRETHSTHHPRGSRHYTDIVHLIEHAGLAPRAEARALAMFRVLGEAEAKVHGIPLERVHFHEVGAVDSIVDLVGSAVCLDLLGVEEAHASPAPLGRGLARSDHGPIPIPAPATVEILRGAPVYGAGIEAELTTPTGAAILRACASSFGPMPDLVIERIGYGAGSRTLEDRPNVLRAILGRPADAATRDRVCVVEANIDDMNPQLYDFLLERLFEAGALDVTLQPVQMKKNRPAVTVSAVGPAALREALAAAILRETTTLGVRAYEASRVKLPRRIEEVDTPYGRVRVKVGGEAAGGTLRETPEYDDARRAARESGVPIREVYEAVRRARERA